MDMVREMDGKPSTDVNTGRVKVLELLSWYLVRLGRAAAEPYAKDIQTACIRTFRTELGTQKSVKAAALLPLTALFKIGLPVLTHQVGDWLVHCPLTLVFIVWPLELNDESNDELKQPMR